MDNSLTDKYLNALFVKSKGDFRKGYSKKLIAKLINIDGTTAQNALHYLSGKNLIDTKNGYGDNVSLTHQGIDYVQDHRKGKTFKVVKFKEARYIPPASRLVFGFLYWYSVINEDKTIEDKVIGVYTSDVLSMIWQLPFNQRPKDAEKILLQFAKDTVIEKLKEGTLNEQEEVVLLTANQPQTCPYNPENLIETEFAEFEVETGNKLLMEEIKENKLAASTEG